MTAAPTTADRETRMPTSSGRPGFGSVLRSEWTKLMSVRSTRILLGVLLLVTVGISAVMALFGSAGDMAAEQAKGQYQVIFFSSGLGVWLLTFIAARMMATEFTHKTATYTFVATPHRPRVLAAKVMLTALLGVVLGVVVVTLNIALTQAALAAGGYPTLNLADPSLWRAALVFVPVSMLVQSVLGALCAVLVRNAFGALAVVLLINALPVTLAAFLGSAYRNTVPRFMPGAAVESLAGLSHPGSGGYLPWAVALLVLVVWLTVFWLLARRRLVANDVG